ncbi:dual specificity protein phosphatase CDC14A-like [Diaphorina citri]|uniref:protein-tyrosine-phosphatase n=1 Tax=Diaphorina citri TaxID=121845 RepID=A0A1S4EM09_DIACI|nr:dual specificity protein phosphatase CDC14A-like [Diaphorina citri]
MNKHTPLEGHDVKDLDLFTEIQKDRLYFATFKSNRERPTTTKIHFFCTDETHVYLNFFGDFGPICLSTLYRYCDKLKAKLNSSTLKHKVIIHYTGNNPKKRLNAAFLIGCYAIIYLKFTPNEIYKALQANNKVPFIAFQDASDENSKYTLELLECFNAVFKARQHNLFDFDDFDVDEMEKYERIQFGDISWIVPNKLLAFSGPNTTEQNTCYHPPEFYLDYFLQNGVQLVVRLNQKNYDERKFTEAGLDHVDFYFPDGTAPPNDILCEFIKVCEKYKGPIAVHCKAGLGRTGCLIGAYMIKHVRRRRTVLTKRNQYHQLRWVPGPLET